MAVVWQISVVPFQDYTLISGVILEKDCPVKNTSSHLWPVFLSTFKTYFRKPVRDQEIYIQLKDDQIATQTNKAGEFWVETKLPVTNNIEVFIANQNIPLGFCQSYPVFQESSSASLSAISDIDDTILVTYTANFLKRISTTLFIAPDKRKPISFIRSILTTIHQANGQIFYVSKSESNLFGVLTAVIQNHKIPQGHLFLTSYLRFNQLLNPKKGKDYKSNRIKKVLDNSPGMKFILLGDDTQHDIRVYTEIALSYPEKILKIYIRRTIKSLSPKKKNQLNSLKQLSVPVLYFSDLDDVREELSFLENFINK